MQLDFDHVNIPPNNETATAVPRPKSLKAIGAPRPSTAKKRKPHRRPNQTIAMQKRYPAFRAKQIESRRRTALDRARHPEKYSRVGVPNGMRKAEAHALWDQASTLADAAMKRLEAQGVVERAVVPDTDDDLAKKALHEAFKLALGPRQCKGPISCRSVGAHVHEAKAAQR